MPIGKLHWGEALAIFLLLATIITGGIVAGTKYRSEPPIEIILPQSQEIEATASEATPGPQKINVNRAEAWLLEALPGIGDTLARHIVDYRQQHGPFQSPWEITKVDGIGPTTYEQIKDLITVTDW